MKCEITRWRILEASHFGFLDSAELSALAHDSDECIRTAAKRLKKCDDAIAQNALAEAVRISETAPRLPDQLPGFQISQSKLWKSLLAEHGLPEPVELMRKSVERLAELYKRPATLPHLRESVQISNGNPASAREQIARLRLIRAFDPDNLEERAQLAALEKTRIEQILQRLNEPGLSPQEADELLAELKDARWTHAPSAVPLRSAAEICQRLKQSRAEILLAHHASTLRTATEANDLHRMQSALAYIANLKTEWHVRIPQPLEVEIQNAHSFCENQRTRLQQAIASLEAVLDEGGSALSVEMQLEQFQKTGQKLPTILNQRVQSYLQRMELAAQRQQQRQTLLRAGVAVLLSALGIVVFQYLRADAKGRVGGVQPDTLNLAENAKDIRLATARAALPDLERYATLLAEGRGNPSAGPEFQNATQWTNCLAAYRIVLRLGDSLKDLRQSASPVTFDDWQKALKGQFFEYSAAGPYSKWMDRYARRATLAQDKSFSDNLEALLTSDALNKLRIFRETDGAGHSIATWYTQAGCVFEPAPNGFVQIQVMIDDPNASQLKTFAKNRVSQIQSPPHTAVCTALLKFLHTERDTPSWVPDLAQIWRITIETPDMDPYVRLQLIQLLAKLDADYFHALSIPSEVIKSLHTIGSPSLEFWLSGSSPVQAEGRKIAEDLAPLQPKFISIADQADALRAEWLLALPGLLRPLTLAAVVELDSSGHANAHLLNGESTCRELWTVVNDGSNTHFQIAAVRNSDSKWVWMDGIQSVPGQPLLTPTDGSSTPELWVVTAGSERQTPIDPFPLNTLAAKQALGLNR